MIRPVFEVAIFLVACAFAIKYIRKSHHIDDDKPLDERVENDPRLAAVVLTLDERRLLPDQKLAAIKSVKNRTGFELKDAYAVVTYYLKHTESRRQALWLLETMDETPKTSQPIQATRRKATHSRLRF